MDMFLIHETTFSCQSLVAHGITPDFDFMGGDPNYERAWEIAHPKVIAIEVSTSVEEAARRMLDAEVHRLIVTDGETMVGMLSALDFVKLVAEGGDGTT